MCDWANLQWTRLVNPFSFHTNPSRKQYWNCHWSERIEELWQWHLLQKSHWLEWIISRICSYGTHCKFRVIGCLSAAKSVEYDRSCLFEPKIQISIPLVSEQAVVNSSQSIRLFLRSIALFHRIPCNQMQLYQNEYTEEILLSRFQRSLFCIFSQHKVPH